ncbi:MAG: amino acid transporter [Desulfocapsa sp.]|nr:MAG: amino acid transporter [Desulfocapsa sp.]
MTGFLAGLSLGFSLIIAIGSQNAFVLKQGLKKEHVFLICLLCSVSDAVLITAGVSGFSAIITRIPWIETVARYGGAIFLACYGTRSFWTVLKTNVSLTPAGNENNSLAVIVTTCLAFTWLNPHVYLDTVVLLGAISAQFPGQKNEFAAGAVLASFVFFYALGYGARILTPIFKKPVSWKVLDFVIGMVMWSIAIRLVRG